MYYYLLATNLRVPKGGLGLGLGFFLGWHAKWKEFDSPFDYNKFYGIEL
jgi:hypothetical protein